MNQLRDYDIIVWGASGFTGKLVAEYLFKKYGSNKNLKWAIAGRNSLKLNSVRKDILDSTVPLILADSNDSQSLNEMVKKTKVICTTVGPYAKYGSKLVAACVENKTHYCDLAGEVQWIRKMIDQYHKEAKNNNTKIVNSCGFDSIPSDMGVYYIQKQTRASKNQRAKLIEMRVAGAKGGISGGTYESLSKVNEEANKDKEIFKVVINPYGLNPIGEQDGLDRSDLRKIIYDKSSNSWIGPFMMAAINTKIVRRSNALSNYYYGKDFMYNEATLSGKGILGKIKGYFLAIPVFLLMSAKPGSILKKFIDFILPKPGEGPNKKDREAGFYNLRFYITLEDGSKAFAKVIGDMDPGYGSTAKMLAESAVCLAKDELPDSSGVLTPSTAMGDALLDRLEKNAGLSFNFNNK
ncbi:MAG: saccharopine dehydrogenase NADP-binding domain-containing protein [Pelagibacterales bacterium]|nr:saccharopine dehydrogenase NADP-binding domain-containing protein [Pelagibacterales bacterium]